jgi:hypothetical protein
MKKLNLLIHPGLGKTATSWMQSSVFPNLKNCIFLGKPGMSQKLKEAQYQLFDSLINITRYRARNSGKLIDEYVETLSKEIIQRFPRTENKGYFILSDECIFDYTNYNGELNTYLLNSVLNKLRDSLDSFCEVSVSILITIREQYSLLRSLYTYDYGHQVHRFPTFDKFLDYGIKNPQSSMFGCLQYDQIYKQLKSIYKEDRLIFVPYEFLVKNPALFLEKSLIDFGASDLDELKKISSSEGSKPINDKQTLYPDGNYKLRWFGNQHPLLTYIGQRKHFIPEKYHPILKSIKHYLKPYLEPFYEKDSVRNSDFAIENFKTKKMIQDIYCDSNRLLSDIIGVDLGGLGYSVRKTDDLPDIKVDS